MVRVETTKQRENKSLYPVSRTAHFFFGSKRCSAFSLVAFISVALFFATAVIVPAFGDNVEQPAGMRFTVMTFNTGTGASKLPGCDTNLGYGPEQARISDAYYGNSLAWKPAVDAVREFVQGISPDIVAFQEMFYCEECADVPEEARPGFVCEDWKPGSPTVAQLVLGEEYQIATHPGNNDKCLAVHKRFGRIRGCEEDFSLGGLEGFRIENCGGGARVARAVIDCVSGETITVISCHGTSGILAQDRECRARQVEQIFVDFGDGIPGVNGTAHLILGDLNTDPKRMRCIDRSARRWHDFVGTEKPFHFVTDAERCAPGGYLGFIHIDHIISDVFQGEVLNLGDSEEIFHFRMFDHTPVVARMRAGE